MGVPWRCELKRNSPAGGASRPASAAPPFLDVLVAAADRVSRVAGRGQPDPEPPRRTLRADARTTLDGGPERP